MAKVIIVGSSNTDLVFTTPKMPQPGETIMGTSFAELPGGKGGNQAVAVARAGAAGIFVARVGKDAFGPQALQNYRADGLDTSYLKIDPEAPTGTAMILVDDQTGQNSIVVVPGANGNLSPEDIEAAAPAFRSAKVLLVQLETPLPSVQRSLELAKAHGLTTILNPAPARKLPEALLRLVDIITPNESETEVLTGIHPSTGAELQDAARMLHAYIPTVVVTLGERGAFLSANGTTRIIPTERVRAVDTTAAGDVFNGYLAAGIAGGHSLVDSIQRANRAAAVSVTRRGAQPSIPVAVA